MEISKMLLLLILAGCLLAFLDTPFWLVLLIASGLGLIMGFAVWKRED